MNKAEFKKAFALAESDVELINEVDLSPFDGFGLPDFQPVAVTTAQVAGLLRWQGQFIFGGWDMEAVNEVRNCGRRRFEVID